MAGRLREEGKNLKALLKELVSCMQGFFCHLENVTNAGRDCTSHKTQEASIQYNMNIHFRDIHTFLYYVSFTITAFN